MPAITTTLAKIRAAGPCEDGYKTLCNSLGGVRKYGKDTPVTFRQIVESNGVDDALWCLRTLPEHGSLWRHFAVDYAERVKHLMMDARSLNALAVARRHALGEATDEELEVAWAAARDAAWDAAWAAAWAAARAAAWDAAWAAAWAAARAAARAAAWAAAWDAAWAAERQWQAARLIELTEAGEWTPVDPKISTPKEPK